MLEIKDLERERELNLITSHKYENNLSQPPESNPDRFVDQYPKIG